MSAIMLPLGLAVSLLAMPNPLMSFTLGIFIGFVPLFMLNQKLCGWHRFFINLIFTEIFALCLIIPMNISTIFFMFPDSLMFIALFMVIGLAYALVFSFASYLSDRYSWNMSPLFFGITWVVSQHSLFSIPIAFAFPVESALACFPPMIQTARFAGTDLIAFIIMFTNAVIANTVVKRDKKIWTASLAIIILLHSANLCYGYRSLKDEQKHEMPVKIAIVQTNLSLMDYALKEQNRMFKNMINNRMIEMTKDSVQKHPKLVIWPELSGDYILQNDEYLGCLRRNVTSLGAELLVGTSYIDYTRNRKKFNIAFIQKADGSTTEPYRKNRIFPFFETEWASRGSNCTTLQSSTPLKDIGCMICLESLYPHISRGLTRAGAKVLVCISTDTSFGNSMIPYIHSASMVFRAIENNKYGVHVGNSGPSIVCDNKGRMITQIPYGRTAYANAVIYPKD